MPILVVHWVEIELIIENEKTNVKTRAILPTTSCPEVATTTIEEHVTSSSDAVVVCPDKKLSQWF